MEYKIEHHSEKIQNYIRSIIEFGEPVEEKEFKEIYKKLSESRHKGHGASSAFKRLKKLKLIKFI